MISREEIKKLAQLARLEIREEEVEELRGEMDSILDYVGQVGSITPLNIGGERGDMNSEVVNIMRKDGEPTPSCTYNKELIAEFPDSQDSYLKVKKIL